MNKPEVRLATEQSFAKNMMLSDAGLVLAMEGAATGLKAAELLLVIVVEEAGAEESRGTSC